LALRDANRLLSASRLATVEGVFVDDGGHGYLGPLLTGPIHGLVRAWDEASPQPGDPVQGGGFVHDHGLAEHRAASVGGVAQHAPHHRAVPAVLAGAGGHLLVGEPAGEFGDGGAVLGVAAEQLSDQCGLVFDDLVGGADSRGLTDIAVAERGAAQHVDRSGLGAVRLATPVALHDLRLLVLGEHALELHQQLVLRGIAARALDELHPRTGAGELLDQQRLVSELAGQPVGRVAQHHIDPDPGHQITQPLQRGAHQGGAAVALVFEHPLVGDLKPQPLGAGAQHRRLRGDRLVLLLPGRRPGRRLPRWSFRVLPSSPARSIRTRLWGTRMA